MFILPKVDSFGTQLAKGLGGSTGEGLGNTPNLLMDLLKHKREREAQFGKTAVELASAGGKNLSLDAQKRIFEQGAALGNDNKSPKEAHSALLGQRIKEEDQEHRIEENIDPERWYKKFTDPFTGESSEDRASKKQNLPKQLEGLNRSKREKRELLSKKLQPEEIEETLNPLSKEANSSIGSFPDLTLTRPKKKTGILGEEGPDTSELTEPQREFFKKHLADVFQKDPEANPLLVRREFEKRGVSWREYRDAIDQLQQEGIVDFSTNEDFAQLEKYLNKPPLGPLDKLLHSMKFIGR